MKEDKRQHVQKRLVLSNLREVYSEFKERFPGRKIGFSKFAELRPKHCVLAGASGTHTQCMCAQYIKGRALSFHFLPGLKKDFFPLGIWRD